jgi:hypothetical protein
MHENLRKYLEEISHHLAASKEQEEILTELKSHILEKAEQEFGEVTEDALNRVIDAYGSPRKVAEKYMEGYEIIAPSFRGYLIRYTSILFAFHFGLTLLSLIFKTSMLVFPFFYIPKIDSFMALFYLPMTFVFDLGLVGIILYFVTQSRKDVRLPWPKLKLNWQKTGESRQTKSKIISLILMLLGYTALVWIYWRFDTLFFKSINFEKTQSLLTPAASQWYSLALLALLGIGIVACAIKFFIPSEWVNLLRSALQLVILGVLINRPIDNPFSEFIYLDLQITANIIIAIIAIGIAIDFLKSIFILGKEALMKKTFS